MISFGQYLRENNFEVTCSNCLTRLWKYNGPKPLKGNTPILSQYFKSLDKSNIPNPEPNSRIVCPLCYTGLVFDHKT